MQEDFNAAASTRQPGPRPSRRSAEEDRAWARLYGDISHPAAAEEVVRQLDADPQAKHSHLALYLRAKATLRRRKTIESRNQRIGAFVRLAVTLSIVAPLRLLRSALSASADVAVEILPPVRREPAGTRAKALRSDPDFGRTRDRFGAADGSAADSSESRNAKAA
jgi:hypothetical protein